jgi:hypothetical protein
MTAPTPIVRLTAWDAYLLAALAETTPARVPLELDEFIRDCDWLNRWVPDFDDLSYGLPRLEAAGYLVIEREPQRGLLLAPTEAARALRRSYRAKTLGGVIVGMKRALGVADEYGAGDRSLGRLTGFEPEELDRAIEAYERRFWRSYRRWSVVSAPLMLVLRVWLAVWSLIDRVRGIDRLAPDGDVRLVRLLPPTLGGERVVGHGYIGVAMPGEGSVDIPSEESLHVRLLRRLGADGSDTAQTSGYVAGGELELSALRVGGVDGNGLVDAWLAAFGELVPSVEASWAEVEGQAVWIVPLEEAHIGLVPLAEALVTLTAPEDSFEPCLGELLQHLLSIGAISGRDRSQDRPSHHRTADHESQADEGWARRLLASLVDDSISERTLREDGWFHEAVIESFAFLVNAGFVVSDPFFHQNGHSIRLSNGRYGIYLEYGPVDDFLWDMLSERATRQDWRLDDFIASRDPAANPPPRKPFDRSGIVERIGYWATCLKRLAPELVAADPAGDLG